MNKEIEEIIRNRIFRKQLSYNDNMYFFFIYLSNYVKYKLAEFQQEIFKIINNDENKLVVVTAFRGSAKSTIITLSYALWSILGKNKKKFVLIISKTQEQSKIHFKNIISEIENNELLKKDFNLENKNVFINQKSIYLRKFDATIKCASFETSIRGMRHKETRPDLIICDDIEDLESVRSIESRNKLETWFTSEIIPLGDKNTKLILVGNLLHEDSLIMRIKNKIENNKIKGVYKEYPLVKDSEILWKEKFSDKEEIEELRMTIGNEVSFQREYMLTILPDDYQIIKKEWIKYYDSLPVETSNYYIYGNIIGVDPAISKNERADYTAIVSVAVYKNTDKNIFDYYILANPINKRLDAPEQVEYIREIYNALYKKHNTKVFVENVAYQVSLVQFLQKEGIQAEEFSVNGTDKTARLNIASLHMQNGRVFFPANGCDELMKQLLSFNEIEKNHDDLVDAFSMAIIEASKIKTYNIID